METRNSDVAIEVTGVTKSFRIPLDGGSNLKQIIVQILRRRKGYREFTPLSNVSLTIKKGEFFGIVGRNGSGKSTLLKIIAGIYQPDLGGIKVNGTLVPFIELGVGFNPELTGRENVFLNGALLGFSRDEMEAMYEEIVDFAELHDFMEEQLKNYSSGMQVRLAFSIAIRAQGDVLLLDEVLAVGDAAFQRKCYEYFAHLKKMKKTVILVTHSMENVQQFCSRALLLNEGSIMEIGEPNDIATAYNRLNRPEASDDNDDVATVRDLGADNPLIKDCQSILTTDSSKGKTTRQASGDDQWIKLSSSISLTRDVSDVFFALTIRKQSGELVYWYSTEQTDHLKNGFKKGAPFTITHTIDNVFGEDAYQVGLYVKSNDRSTEYVVIDNALEFQVVDRGTNGYMLHPKVVVDVE